MAFVTVKTKGQKKVFQRMKAVLKTPTYRVLIENKPTTSTYYKSIPGTSGSNRQTTTEKVNRTAVENTNILRRQAEQGRNAIYMTKQEKKILDDLIKEGIHAINKKLSHTILNRASVKLGKKLSEFYANHIRDNKGPKGKFKENTKGTSIQKAASQSPGAVDKSLISKLTPLIETGALLKSFIFKVNRLNRGR